MKKLEINSIKKHEYNLKDEYGNKYNFVFDFFDIEYKPQIGDYIYLNEELLNPKYEGYSTYYVFGNLDNKHGKSNILKDDIDVIKIVATCLEIYLKRLYG